MQILCIGIFLYPKLTVMYHTPVEGSNVMNHENAFKWTYNLTFY